MTVNQYNLRDIVYLHIGEPTLVKGRVVDIVNLAHLNEGHKPEDELYIIEIKTGIDYIYEARSFVQLSSSATGPIGLFKNNNVQSEQRYLKKIGVVLPLSQDTTGDLFNNDPTTAEINAALVRTEQQNKHTTFTPSSNTPRPKKPWIHKSKKK